MRKYFMASFNRASDGAVAGISGLLEEHGMLTHNVEDCDCIIACGDRSETLSFVLSYWQRNVPIIHLWAGECSNFAGTHDDVYRAALSLMSDVQLCVNHDAFCRVHSLFRAVGKKPRAYVVGNPYLDDMATDDSVVPDDPYDLILYNPVTTSREGTESDISDILKLIDKTYIWLAPNGDMYSDLVPYNMVSLPRPLYLGLLKNCQRFITNSSSQYTEAAYFRKRVVQVGVRNELRDSKNADMMIPGCKENILGVLSSLE